MSIRQMLILISVGTLLGSFWSTVKNVEDKSPFSKHAVITAEKAEARPLIPGKPNTAIRIHLTSPSGLAFTGDEITEIQAMLQLSAPAQNAVNYHWVLPQGVVLMDGEMRGTLPSLQVDEIYRTSIRVKGIGYKELPTNISFTAQTQLNGQNVGATAIFGSHELQANGNFRVRKEREPANSSGWLKKASDDEPEIPRDKAPKGIHF